MDAFIGEIRAFPFNFAPQGWAFCDGQQMRIQQNTALFSIIGTMYGGNGTTTFQLPNLNGRTAIHTDGGTYLPGKAGGAETVPLSADQLPPHTHNIGVYNRTVVAQASLLTNMPGNTVYLTGADSIPDTGTITTSLFGYTDTVATTLNANALSSVGATPVTPHENRMPYVVMNYCICIYGEFPARG